jgi:hypothetical protein
MYAGKEAIVVEQVRVSSADPSFSCVGQVGGFGGEDSSFKRQGGDFLHWVYRRLISIRS